MCTEPCKSTDARGAPRVAERADIEVDEKHSGRADELFGVVYSQLKRLAHQRISHGDESINTTGLVHELYLRVCVGRELTFADRTQFFAYAARAMRSILIDRARRRITLRLGSTLQRADLTESGVASRSMSPQSALQLDSALTALEAADARAARVVELHYFTGLPLHSVAEILGVVRRTADRDWRFARSFLLAHIG